MVLDIKKLTEIRRIRTELNPDKMVPAWPHALSCGRVHNFTADVISNKEFWKDGKAWCKDCNVYEDVELVGEMRYVERNQQR